MTLPGHQSQHNKQLSTAQTRQSDLLWKPWRLDGRSTPLPHSSLPAILVMPLSLHKQAAQAPCAVSCLSSCARMALLTLLLAVRSCSACCQAMHLLEAVG
jgi:hypothetical protein